LALGFQDPATPVMEGIDIFHDDLMFFVIVISVFVVWIMYRTIILFTVDSLPKVETAEDRLNEVKIYSQGVYHNTFIEIVWTIVPALILAVIAVPSFALLYSMEELVEPTLSIKVTGHQWYWCYEYSTFKNPDLAEHIEGLKFESYMIPVDDLEKGNLRLLEVDNRLLLPIQTHISVGITAADVLHCWAVPSLGVKVDACPGRMNTTTLFLKREGIFYGQCSEICGINHGFMPIVVEGLSMYDFLYRSYVNSLLDIIEDNPELEGYDVSNLSEGNNLVLNTINNNFLSK
jgi:cytochrome c oxidase subunit 2